MIVIGDWCFKMKNKLFKRVRKLTTIVTIFAMFLGLSLTAVGDLIGMGPLTVKAEPGSVTAPKNPATAGTGSTAKDKGSGDKSKDKDKDKDSDKDKDDSDKDKDSGGGGNSGDDADKYSFYHVASNAAVYYDHSQNHEDAADDSKKKAETKFYDSGVTMGDAGGLIGYEDSKYDKDNWIGAVTANLSSSSESHDYATYDHGATRSLYEYTLYGHALNQMGLDSSTQPASFTDMARMITGGLMMIAYYLAGSVNLVFSWVVKILKFLNIFKVFDGPTINYNMGQGTSDLMNAHMGKNDFLMQYFGNVVKPIQSVYVSARHLGLYVVLPLFLVSIIILGFITDQFNKGGRIKKLIVGFFGALLGVAMCGSLYTQALDQFNIDTNQHNAADIALGHAYVDFADWAKKAQLGLPAYSKKAGAAINVSTNSGSNSAGTVTNGDGDVYGPRDLASVINHDVAQVDIGESGVSQAYQASDIWNYSPTNNNKKHSKLASFKGTKVLLNYMNASKYLPADFETQYKADINAGDKKYAGQIFKGLKAVTDGGPNFFVDNPKKAGSKTGYFTGSANPATNPNYVGNSSKLTDQKGKMRFDFLTGSTATGIQASKNKGGTYSFYGSTSTDNDNLSGLSPLAMYNYLSTDFTGSNVVVYSSKKATSGLVLSSHHAVNLVGLGFKQWLYYFNTLAVLICIGILGWGYAIATLFMVAKNMLKMVLHAIGAATGIAALFIRFVVTVIVSITQLLVTDFVYMLSSDILIGINMGAGTLFNNANAAANSGKGLILMGNFAKVNGGLEDVYLLFVTVLTVYGTKVLLKFRPEAVNQISRFFGDALDKWLNVGDYAMGGHSGYYQPPTSAGLADSMNNSGLGNGLSDGSRAGIAASDGALGERGTDSKSAGPTSGSTVKGGSQQQASGINGKNGTGGSNGTGGTTGTGKPDNATINNSNSDDDTVNNDNQDHSYNSDDDTVNGTNGEQDGMQEGVQNGDQQNLSQDQVQQAGVGDSAVNAQPESAETLSQADQDAINSEDAVPSTQALEAAGMNEADAEDAQQIAKFKDAETDADGNIVNNPEAAKAFDDYKAASGYQDNKEAMDAAKNTMQKVDQAKESLKQAGVAPAAKNAAKQNMTAPVAAQLASKTSSPLQNKRLAAAQQKIGSSLSKSKNAAVAATGARMMANAKGLSTNGQAGMQSTLAQVPSTPKGVSATHEMSNGEINNLAQSRQAQFEKGKSGAKALPLKVATAVGKYTASAACAIGGAGLTSITGNEHNALNQKSKELRQNTATTVAHAVAQTGRDLKAGINRTPAKIKNENLQAMRVHDDTVSAVQRHFGVTPVRARATRKPNDKTINSIRQAVKR